MRYIKGGYNSGRGWYTVWGVRYRYEGEIQDKARKLETNVRYREGCEIYGKSKKQVDGKIQRECWDIGRGEVLEEDVIKG